MLGDPMVREDVVVRRKRKRRRQMWGVARTSSSGWLVMVVIQVAVVGVFLRAEAEALVVRGNAGLLLEGRGWSCESMKAAISSSRCSSALSSSERRGHLVMKSNSKKKKSKAAKSTSSPASATGSGSPSVTSPAPQRVDPNSGASLRMQLQFAQMKKERQRQAYQRPSKVQRTTYRKDKDDEPEYVEEPDLSKVKVSTVSPTLMIDGYNLLNFWEKTQTKIQSGSLQEARQILLSALVELSSMRGWRTTVVYDAYNTSNTMESKVKAGPYVMEVYTANGQSADNYIERETQRLKDEGRDNVMVATGDYVITTVAGSHGAQIWSPAKVIQEIRIAQRESIAIADQRRKNKIAARHAAGAAGGGGGGANTAQQKKGFGILEFMDEDTRNLILSRRVGGE